MKLYLLQTSCYGRLLCLLEKDVLIVQQFTSFLFMLGVVCMTEASVVMDEFMKRLSNNGFRKDICSEDSDHNSCDESYSVDERMYVSLLKSGLLDAVLDESVI